MSAPINPYESPASLPDGVQAPQSRAVLAVLLAVVRLGLLAVLIGVCLGLAACWLFSGGNATGQFYVVYGVLGSLAGLVGAIPAGMIIAVLRAADHAKKRRSQERACYAATRGLRARQPKW